MKQNILIPLLFLVVTISLSGQSVAIYVEDNQIKDTTSQPLTFGSSVDGFNVNGFYGFVAKEFDFGLADPASPSLNWAQTVLSGINWNPLIDGSPAGVQWMTPGAEGGPTQSLTPSNSDLAVDTKPLIVFVNAADPNALSIGSQIVLGEGLPFESVFDNRAASVQQGAFAIVAGVNSSLGMVAVVPEPSHFALAFGLIGLGVVVWRRRRERG